VYLILNASRYRGPRVVTRVILGSGSCQILQNGARHVLNTRVYCHSIVKFRVDRNFVIQVGLEVGPVSALEIKAIQWV